MKNFYLYAVSIVLISNNLFAQEIEEITVTGSYIGSKSEKISVQVIDETEFDNLNVTSVGEISKYLSSSSGSHFQSNTLDGVDQGMSSITLRGLDHASTLVLLNNKRQTFAGTPSHEGEGYIDVNIIPEIALSRIEILKEGATSLYGSDAVAGVINFITHDEFVGTKISLTHQETSDYDQTDKTLGIIFGKEFDNANLVPDTVLSGNYAGAYTSGQWVPDPQCEENGGVLAGPFCKFLYGTRFNIVNDEDHKKFYLSYKKQSENFSYKLKAMAANIDVNDNPQSPSYPALSFMSKKILAGQGGSPFNVPVIWYGRPLGSAFPSPLSPKDIDQYHLSGVVNINLANDKMLTRHGIFLIHYQTLKI